MKTHLFRGAFGAALVFALVLGQVTRVLAGTSGVISGTVTSADTKAPIAAVKVSAVSPSGTYSTTTDSHGFYSITGVSPDTYTMSFSIEGYQPYAIQGATVVPDQTTYVNAALEKSTKVIGTVSVRAQAGAFQPKQTEDTYTVTTATINTIQGNSLNISESNLITSLPGATTDSSGYPTIRGGRENEQGFEFEGIPYVDAFTNQFTNTLATPGLGLQAVQLTPGAGNASFGNIGTGTLNLVAKRGSYPGYANAEGAIGTPNFQHDLNVEFGTAAPDGKWSEYITFAGQDTGYYYGRDAAPAAQLLVFGSVEEENDRELLNNFVYKLGKNNNQSIQLFYDEAQHDFIGGLGGNPYCFTTCSPTFGDEIQFYSGLFNPPVGPPSDPGACNVPTPYPAPPCDAFGGQGLTRQQIEQLIQMDPYQTFPTETLAQANRPPFEYYQPNNALKLQWDDNINSGTTVSLKAYKVNVVTTFDFPEPDGLVLQQGGFTNGMTASMTTQLNDKNLLEFGADYQWLHPVYNQPSDQWGILSTLLGGGDPLTGLGAFEAWDFLSRADLASSNPNLSYCPFGGCGYLDQFFPNGQPPQIPDNLEQSVSNRQDESLFADNTWSPSDNLKVELGLRLDAVNYKLPSPQVYQDTCTTLYEPTSWDTNVGAGDCPIATFNDVTNAQLEPRIWQPRFATSYQLGTNDSVRFSYGRSVLFPPLGQVDLYDPPGQFAAFYNIPSFDYLGCALTGGVGTSGSYCTQPASGGNPAVSAPANCGILGFQVPCKNYGEQLYWENQDTIEGVPLQPIKPETFNNYDFSYSHEFPDNLSFKITPWYRRGYDATASVQSPIVINGQAVQHNGVYQFAPPVATNLGIDKATGIEFLLTKAAARGLTGQLSMSYQNEFSNVIPLSGSEDFFPSIPPASLALGNLYHVGFLTPFATSLDLNYTTPSGWRISPQYQWDIGYPQGAGLTTAAFIDGVPYNIPNTNASSSINEAPAGTIAYVDPLDPGSLFNPNIAATRGTPEGSSPGAKLSHPDSTTNLTVEYHDRGSGMIYGFTVDNVFNDVYSGAFLNGRYQPLATGIAGPLTGYSTSLPYYPTLGYANYTPLIHGEEAYADSPNNFGRTFYFYVQTKL
jgi:hypothetical protein